MMNLEVIHRSITEADDLEEVRDEKISIGDVLRSLAQHPAQIITRWNWKSALMGAILRASFYLTIYKVSKESWMVTLSAVLVEFGFRFVTSGISGALVQSFRRATPIWLATLIVMITLPIFSHTVEYITHYAQENLFSSIFAASENNARQKAFAISVMFSILSALFNLFVMRHGVLLVGAGSETKSLASDLKRIPLLIVEFVVFLPNEILCAISKRKILTAIGIFSAFGFAVGAIFGVFRGKWSWAWTTALGAWAILFLFTLIVAGAIVVQKKLANN
ncbi:MAG: hypothetical protein LC768_06000 [Acidobacteria bacterium]|nr:hypothetical protein [Acidobacteriota bacterium]MCA1637876.1 hypothetical protein [Acidobacteriota bacterium]